MSVNTPAPVKEVEKEVEDVAPAAVRPEVKAVEDEFNRLYGDAAEQAPKAAVSAAENDPAVAKAAEDAKAILFDHASVAPGTLLGDVKSVATEVKAGYKTTEFWGAALIILLSQVGALHLPGKYGDTITTTSAAVAYIVSRGLAKLGH